MKRQLVTAIFVVSSLLIAPTFVAAQQPAAAADAPQEDLTKSDDPAVQALLDTRPTTPVDLLNVIGLLLDLEQPKYAKPLLTKLLAAAADEATLDSLGRKYGNQIFFRLAATPVLQPEAQEFADKVSAAMKSAARNPERIAALVGRLLDPSLDVRAAAIANLRIGGDASAAAVGDALLKTENPNERRMYEIALAGMGEEARGLLGAMLASGNKAAITSATAALALVEEPAVLPELYVASFAPTMPAEVSQRAGSSLTKRLGKPTHRIEAAGRLLVVAEGLYKGRSEASAEPTVVWHWDTTANRPASATLPRRVDELRRAARYAAVAAAIANDHPTAQRLSRGAAFEALFWEAADPAELQQSVAAWVAAERPTRGELEALYEQAAANNRIPAASRLLGLLGAAGTADELLTAVGGRPTVLARAATHADPTIRFAAVETILKLNPTRPFAGSSGVTDALARFASGAGLDRALVVDPHGGRGRDIAAYFIESGVRAEASVDPIAALAEAVAQADVQLVCLDQRFLDPSQGNLLGRLRADFRTARLPVIVFGEPEHVERLRSRLYADSYTLVLYRPTTPEHLTTQLKLNPLPGATSHVAGPERLRRALFALAAMRQMLETKSSVFNLRPYEPTLTAAAAAPPSAKAAVGVLGVFGSSAAQRTLVDTASATALPLDLRQAAAAAFCENVIRFGTLLTTVEIARQYERYNASESLDPPTQALLASMLDVIEAKAGKIPLAGPTESIPAPAAAAP